MAIGVFAVGMVVLVAMIAIPIAGELHLLTVRAVQILFLITMIVGEVNWIVIDSCDGYQKLGVLATIPGTLVVIINTVIALAIVFNPPTSQPEIGGLEGQQSPDGAPIPVNEKEGSE